MGDVYAMADVFAFPSRYEGRPLALLVDGGNEAATCGLPIIATPIAENVEVVGSAAHYVTVDDLDAWVVALRMAVNDASFRDQLRGQIARVDLGASSETAESYLNLMTS